MNQEIFKYKDYREFIKDWCAYQKQNGTGFSMSRFAESAKIKSRTYLANVISKSSPLAKKHIDNVAQAMQLDLQETKFFKLLISFTHSKTDEDKNKAHQELSQFEGETVFKKLESKKFAYFNEWYVPVVREIVTVYDFEEDYQKLGRMVFPEITAKNAHDAVKILLDLKLIEKDGNLYRQTDENVLVRDEEHLLAIRNYQKKYMDLGKEAIERFSVDQRNILSITGSASPECFEELNEAVNKFHQEVIKIFNKYEDYDKTYQMGVQLFPVTRDLKKGKGHE